MRQVDHYKHYIGITSQVPFCQVPLRLDSFNQCSFSCSYCFAKSRGGNRGDRKLQITEAENLKERLDRVEAGKIQSAVDEFLQRKIPIQFGGMTDPFSPLEIKSEISLKILNLLKLKGYPTLLSTKSELPGEDKYLAVLKDGNFLVRFSISVLPNALRGQVEKGMPAVDSILRAIGTLSAAGVSCSVRLQPVFPTYEKFAFELVSASQANGAKHVTFEYLKLPVEDLADPVCRIPAADGRSMISVYRDAGAERQGRELVMPTSYKLGFLSDISRFAREAALTVGFGDNEFLPFSDGNSCCNGADLYLKDATYFDANVAAVVRSKCAGEQICFDDLKSKWIPKKSVETYLNSKSRLSNGRQKASWLDMLEHRWRTNSIYSPSYFYGVSPTGKTDSSGLPTFYRSTVTI